MHPQNGNDFSNQDIRGENFSHKKDCKNKKFQHSKAGIKKVYLYSLIFLFCLLSMAISIALSIAFIPLIGGFKGNYIPLIIASVILAIFLFSIVTKGFTGALLGTGIVSIISLISMALLLRQGENTVVPGVFFGIFAMVIAFGGIVMFAFTLTVLQVLSNKWIKYAAIAMAIVIAIVSVPSIFPRNIEPPHQYDLPIAILLTAIILSVGFYISSRSLHRDPKFDSIRLAAIAFCSRCHSTSFRGVDLTNADFTGATLKNVDFRSANLSKIRLQNVKGLEYAYVEQAYLKSPKVQQLAITLDTNLINNKNFNYLDLEGINLENANLKDISFVGANLKNANLKGADLTGANLKQARLIGADLTGAILTGACIEDWGITKETVLERIDCKYIFLESKEEYDKNGHCSLKYQQRCPDKLEFKEGEFTKFFKRALEQFNSVFNNSKNNKDFLEILLFSALIKNKPTSMNFYGTVGNAVATNQGGINQK